MMVEVKNLSFAFPGGENILSNVSFSAKKGERVCICAPSGEGKTTLLRIIAGLLAPQSGKAAAEGKIGMVFQSDVLFPWATALENVMNTCGRKEAEYWLSRFGLSEDMNKYPAQLSGGMCRRAALARAVGFEPDVLLLDEPFKGLELELKKEIMDILSEYFKERIIIFTTHDDFEREYFSTSAVTL